MSGADIARVTSTLAQSSEGPADRYAAPLSRDFRAAAENIAGVSSHTAGAASSTEASSAVPVGVGHEAGDEKVTGCVCSVIGREPSSDYLRLEVNRDRLPFADKHDAACERCWPQGDPSDWAQAARRESPVATSGGSPSADTEWSIPARAFGRIRPWS